MRDYRSSLVFRPRHRRFVPSVTAAALAIASSIWTTASLAEQPADAIADAEKRGYDMSRTRATDRYSPFAYRCRDPHSRRAVITGSYRPAVIPRRTFVYEELIKLYDQKAQYDAVVTYLSARSCTETYAGYIVGRIVTGWPPQPQFGGVVLSTRPREPPIRATFLCYPTANSWGTYNSTYWHSLWLKITHFPFLDNRFHGESVTLSFDDAGTFCGFHMGSMHWK